MTNLQPSHIPQEHLLGIYRSVKRAEWVDEVEARAQKHRRFVALRPAYKMFVHVVTHDELESADIWHLKTAIRVRDKLKKSRPIFFNGIPTLGMKGFNIVGRYGVLIGKIDQDSVLSEDRQAAIEAIPWQNQPPKVDAITFQLTMGAVASGAPRDEILGELAEVCPENIELMPGVVNTP